jgi:hypothetical protein
MRKGAGFLVLLLLLAGVYLHRVRPSNTPAALEPGPGSPAPPAAAREPGEEELEAAIAALEEPRSSSEPLRVPPQLMLYSDPKRFLAIQAASAGVEEYTRPHDLAALASLVRAGELTPVPALGDAYVLDDVGVDAEEDPLRHYEVEVDLDVPLVPDAASAEQAAAQLAATGNARDEQRAALLRKLWSDPASAGRLAAEHAAITALAGEWDGDSYDLADPADRAAFQSRLLGSMRPAGRDVMTSLAKAYHDRFGRRLPVVSMVRTDRYQRLLSRVNANATDIAVPPHTTGQAFDVSYRYMANDEQNLLMEEIARLEEAGRVEALRERRNCFHVFAFAEAGKPDEAAVAAARAVIAADQEDAEPERPARKPRPRRTTRRR